MWHRCDHISIRRGELLQAQDRPARVSPQITQKLCTLFGLFRRSSTPCQRRPRRESVPHSTRADGDTHSGGPPVSPFLGDFASSMASFHKAVKSSFHPGTISPVSHGRAPSLHRCPSLLHASITLSPPLWRAVFRSPGNSLGEQDFVLRTTPSVPHLLGPVSELLFLCAFSLTSTRDHSCGKLTFSTDPTFPGVHHSLTPGSCSKISRSLSQITSLPVSYGKPPITSTVR